MSIKNDIREQIKSAIWHYDFEEAISEAMDEIDLEELISLALASCSHLLLTEARAIFIGWTAAIIR